MKRLALKAFRGAVQSVIYGLLALWPAAIDVPRRFLLNDNACTRDWRKGNPVRKRLMNCDAKPPAHVPNIGRMFCIDLNAILVLTMAVPPLHNMALRVLINA